MTRKPHNLDDDTLITPALLRHFLDEGRAEQANGQHLAIIQRSNGNFLRHAPGSPDCLPEQSIFATDLLAFLNDEVAFGGAWVMVYTIPVFPQLPGLPAGGPFAEYKRFVLLWLDSDGDLKITIDWIDGESEDELDLHELLTNGLEPWGAKCHAAYLELQEMEGAVGANEEQTAKIAQGQKHARGNRLS